jgi:prolyl-tRNA synthetase
MKSLLSLSGRLRCQYNWERLAPVANRQVIQTRRLHNDGRSRLSSFWTPTGGIAKEGEGKEDSHALLIRAGFIRQAHSGLFQFLPLGLRVQNKLESLLDHHMTQLGASKVSLSTFSSEELWRRSGRLSGDRSELFQLEDRKGARFLLAPTHEEEITSVVADAVHSYKDLPLRLYQITRKYRDEPRPRQGLLRTKEFLMKDLYTFDATKEAALQTYETVRRAYSAFFAEFKIPFLTAEADSGSIGGNLSHEYHILTAKGEDSVISCTSCGYVANEEVAKRGIAHEEDGMTLDQMNFTYDIRPHHGSVTCPSTQAIAGVKGWNVWTGRSRNGQTLYQAIFPTTITQGNAGTTRRTKINQNVLKWVFPDVDFGNQDPVNSTSTGYSQVKWALDYRLANHKLIDMWRVADSQVVDELDGDRPELFIYPTIDLVDIETGDKCQHCKSGTLRVQTAVELGHTFYLGTKYSEPLGARVAGEKPKIARDASTDAGKLKDASSIADGTGPIEMGCHGIGVSRMIAAVADVLADDRGLNWPRVMAPFEAVIIPAKGLESDAVDVFDILIRGELGSATSSESSGSGVDVILDDRQKDMGWKLNDADLIGYPVIVVLGKAWKRERMCEVQCRRLSVKQDVPLDRLRRFIASLLAQL